MNTNYDEVRNLLWLESAGIFVEVPATVIRDIAAKCALRSDDKIFGRPLPGTLYHFAERGAQ